MCAPPPGCMAMTRPCHCLHGPARRRPGCGPMSATTGRSTATRPHRLRGRPTDRCPVRDRAQHQRPVPGGAASGPPTAVGTPGCRPRALAAGRTRAAWRSPRPEIMALRWLRAWREARCGHVYADRHRQAQRHRPAGVARRRHRPHLGHARLALARTAVVELGHPRAQCKGRLTAAPAGWLGCCTLLRLQQPGRFFLCVLAVLQVTWDDKTLLGLQSSSYRGLDSIGRTSCLTRQHRTT